MNNLILFFLFVLAVNASQAGKDILQPAWTLVTTTQLCLGHNYANDFTVKFKTHHFIRNFHIRNYLNIFIVKSEKKIAYACNYSAILEKSIIIILKNFSFLYVIAMIENNRWFFFCLFIFERKSTSNNKDT